MGTPGAPDGHLDFHTAPELCDFYLSKHTWCLTSTETARLIRNGEKRVRGYGGGERGRLLYLSLHCHHRNDSCIKMGSDENHFNGSLF